MIKSVEELFRRLDLEGWSERRNLEFKSGQEWNVLKTKLAKGALALSNIEGGGYIIIGISEDKDGLAHKPEGMPMETAQTYNQDNVSDYINTFADPPIDIEVRSLEDGDKRFVVIKVHGFATEPVICKKDGGDVKEGTLYYRGHRMPQSAPVASSSEMRNIIDRAVDKALTKQHRRLQSYPPRESDRFADEQREESPSEAKGIRKAVQERGHWEICIRPSTYPDNLNRLPRLEDALLKSTVQYRGLPYPYGPQSPNGGIYRLNGCVESRVRWAEFAGVLRLYASGQFVHYMAMPEDWMGDGGHAFAGRDPSRTPRQPHGRPFMYYVSALYFLTEIYMFASRIAQNGILGDNIVIEMALHKQEGRVLKSETKPFVFVGEDVCNAPQIKLGPHHVTAERLRVEHDDMAVRDGASILERYNADYDDAEETLRGWQADFYRGA